MSKRQRWIYGAMAAMFLAWGVLAGLRGARLGWLLVVASALMGVGLLLTIRGDGKRRARGIPPRGSDF